MATGFKIDPSSPFPWIERDTDAVLDYTLDWADPDDNWLGSDTISTLTVTLPDGLTLSSSLVTGARYTTAWVGGAAVPGRDYRVRMKVVTTEGRTDTRTLVLRGVQR